MRSMGTMEARPPIMAFSSPVACATPLRPGVEIGPGEITLTRMPLPLRSSDQPPLILYHISYELRRFGELRRLVQGISEKMLIQQLRELQVDGIVERHEFQEVPQKVEYSITPFIEAATQARRAMVQPQAGGGSA